METRKLSEMINGWFVGAFEPTALSTKTCEVALKYYKKGDNELKHYHMIATEITLIVSGEVIMFDKVWKEKDIIKIFPGESTAFEAITDAITVVVKIPGALNDKYISCNE
jgi:hypothetical protein